MVGLINENPGRFGPVSFRSESFRPWVVSVGVVSALGSFGRSRSGQF